MQQSYFTYGIKTVWKQAFRSRTTVGSERRSPREPHEPLTNDPLRNNPSAAPEPAFRVSLDSEWEEVLQQHP